MHQINKQVSELINSPEHIRRNKMKLYRHRGKPTALVLNIPVVVYSVMMVSSNHKPLLN